MFVTAASVIGVAQTPGGSGCKAVYDAGELLSATPHHAYLIKTSSGRKEGTEQIYTPGGIYIQLGGGWKKSPLTMQEMQKQERENIRDARNAACRHLRDESVNGEPAAVYSAHAEVWSAHAATADLKSDTVVWIAKSSGRILKQEEDIDEGDGGKFHESVRYDYNNVTAPAASR